MVEPFTDAGSCITGALQEHLNELGHWWNPQVLMEALTHSFLGAVFSALLPRPQTARSPGV